VFAFLFLAEVPPAATIIGGATVLFAVFGHAGCNWLVAKRRTAAEP
jgi:drug/metabolite transporter (DMT)-like permease